MTREKKLIMTDRGFFLGRQRKDGSPEKDARRITEEEICTMFAHFFSAYCAHSKTRRLTIQSGDYQIVAVEMPKNINLHTSP